jgi:pyruvate ferredoxin oxidoreductase alpha subunit/phenylglyoxylate dehydrogenase alpha subunit
LVALRRALSKVKALGVVDRSVSFGWNSGPVYQELLSALYGVNQRIPAVSFIGGLAGADITIEHFTRVIEKTARALKGEAVEGPIWLNE